MSHSKPFGAAARALDPALDTEEMTDELLSADGSPFVMNSEDLFQDATPAGAEAREVVPESPEEGGEDTQVDAVPSPADAVDEAVLAEGDVIGELPPPSMQDFDLPVDDIVARCERTDDHLRKWRTTSVDRKGDWEAEQALEMALQSQRRGWFYLGAAGGVTVVMLTFCGMLATGMIGAASVAAVQQSTVRVATPAMPAVAMPEREVEAPVQAPVAAPVEAVAVVDEPVADGLSLEAPAVVAEAPAAAPERPVAEPSAPPVEAVVRDGRPTVLADGKTWTASGFHWAGALVAESGVELAWFDNDGNEVLDRVACAGRDGAAYRCYSGRSPKRILWALETGAAPGTWTVKACTGNACVPLGTTVVEAP